MESGRRLTSRTQAILLGGGLGGVAALVALGALVVGCLASFPAFLDDFRTWHGGLEAKATIVAKAFNESALSDRWLLRYRFEAGGSMREAEIAVRRAEFEALTAGDRLKLRYLPGAEDCHVTEFQEFRTTAAVYGLPVCILLLVTGTLIFFGRFTRWVSRQKLLVRGVAVPFVATHRARVLWAQPELVRHDWYADYTFGGRNFSTRVEFPRCNFPYPQEPARDAILLVDATNPRRCVVARRSAFEGVSEPENFKRTLITLLRGLSEFIASLEVVDTENEQLRRKLRALERDVRHRDLGSPEAVVACVNRELSEHPSARNVMFCWLLDRGPEAISGDELNVLERLGTFRELSADVSYRLSLVGAAIVVAVPSVGMLASNGMAAAFVDGAFLAGLFFLTFAVLRFFFWLDRG